MLRDSKTKTVIDLVVVKYLECEHDHFSINVGDTPLICEKCNYCEFRISFTSMVRSLHQKCSPGIYVMHQIVSFHIRLKGRRE